MDCRKLYSRVKTFSALENGILQRLVQFRNLGQSYHGAHPLGKERTLSIHADSST